MEEIMKKFSLNNLRIGTKYAIAFTITLLLFAISVFIVFQQLNIVNQNIDSMDLKATRSINLTEVNSLFGSKDIRISDYMSSKDAKTLGEYNDRVEQMAKLENQISSTLKKKVQISSFEIIKSNSKKIDDLFLNELVPAVQANKAEEAQAARDTTQSLRGDTNIVLEQLTKDIDKEREQTTLDAKSVLKHTVMILIVAFLVSMIIGVIILIVIGRLVRKNLKKVVNLSKQVADGNLAVETLSYKGKDEIGELNEAMNMMSGNLQSMLKQIINVSDHVSSQSEELTQSSNEVREGSEQVASTMQELADGAEQQAQTSTELSEEINRFTTQVQGISQNGDSIEQTSFTVLSMVEEGNNLMKKSMDQMTSVEGIVKTSVERIKTLDEQSQKISQLVVVIQTIAEQTNLLALNAAIEAARAGEHGRGFAIVAEEVRKLAEQVSRSIVEITGFVGNIQSESNLVATTLEEGYSQVQQGTKQVQQTGEKFEEINNGISDMVKNIKAISTSIRELAQGSERISGSIEHMASISEESAAGVEETAASIQQTSSSMQEIAASAEQLSNQSEKLNGLVNQFQL
jgi:methyl-accepting chemotaxis protein